MVCMHKHNGSCIHRQQARVWREVGWAVGVSFLVSLLGGRCSAATTQASCTCLKCKFPIWLVRSTTSLRRSPRSMQLARPQPCLRACSARAAGTRKVQLVRASQQQVSTNTQQKADESVIPPGCSRYTVTLTKPMGIVLEQDPKTLIITVAEIKSDGSAARSGVISVGDQLIATSGVTYNGIQEYGEVKVKSSQQIVRLRVSGETMKTVSAAIGSHPGHIPVTLELQKCQTE